MFIFALMKLEKYIAQLLYRYECVTVPEFGSFLTEVRPARLQPNTYTFYPPKKVISFHSLLRKNDGLLIHHISQSAKIPYNEAVSLMQQEVSLWKKTLESNQLLELKNIGEIHLNAENNLVFTASENANYLTDSFGLSAVVSPIIRRNYTQEVAPEEINKPEIAVEETPKVISITKARPKTPFIKYGVAAAVIIGAGLFFANNYHQNTVAQQTLLVESKQCSRKSKTKFRKRLSCLKIQILPL